MVDKPWNQNKPNDYQIEIITYNHKIVKKTISIRKE